MMNSKWTTEAKVGAFTLVGIIIFICAIAFVARVDVFGKPQMVVSGQFKQVNGLKAGNQIKFSGVAIGHVESISINPDGVTVRMKIDKGTEIPTDSSFSLASDGFLGDRFIQIVPGKSKQYLHDGDYITGNSQDAMDQTMESAQKLMTSAEKMLESINNIIGDKQTQQALKYTLQSTSTMADNGIAITNNMVAITDQMRQSLEQMNRDGAPVENMRAIIANMKDTTDRIDHMARSMEGVVTDPQASENIKETLHNTAQITSRINAITGGTPYKHTEKKNGKDEGSSQSSLKGEPSVEMLYNTKIDEFRVNANYRFFTNKTLGEIGLSNIGDGTDFNLNGGQYITSNLAWRAGLFDSELGVALDYGVTGPYRFSAVFYDLNHPTYRFRGEARIGNDRYGVVQMTRPYSKGGVYFGVKQLF